MIMSHQPDLFFFNEERKSIYYYIVTSLVLFHLIFLLTYLMNVARKCCYDLRKDRRPLEWKMLLVDKPCLYLFVGYWILIIGSVQIASLNDLVYAMNPRTLVEKEDGPFNNNPIYKNHEVAIYYDFRFPDRALSGKTFLFIDDKGKTKDSVERFCQYSSGKMILDLDGDGLKELVDSGYSAQVYYVNEEGKFVHSLDLDEFEHYSRCELIKVEKGYVFKVNKNEDITQNGYFVWRRGKGFEKCPVPLLTH